MNTNPGLVNEEKIKTDKKYYLNELFSINPQAGKLRILIIIACCLITWFLLSLVLLLTKPNSSDWLVHLFGPPKNLLVDIVFDFLANSFSLQFFVLSLISLAAFKISMILVEDFFSKLFNCPEKKYIRNHLTKCLFSIPDFSHIDLETRTVRNQYEKVILSAIGGPAYLSSREDGILIIEKGLRKPEISIDVILGNKDYYLENKYRLTDFFSIANVSKFERLVGQSQDGVDIEFLDIEIKYHINTPTFIKYINQHSQRVRAWFYYKNGPSSGFETCLSDLFQIIIFMVIRNNPSTTFKKIASNAVVESLDQPKLIVKKMVIHKHKNMYAYKNINIFCKRSGMRRNRNLGIYPFLRKIENPSQEFSSLEKSLNELMKMIRIHTQKTLDEIFDRNILIIESIKLKGINYVSK